MLCEPFAQLDFDPVQGNHPNGTAGGSAWLSVLSSQGVHSALLCSQAGNFEIRVISKSKIPISDTVNRAALVLGARLSLC